MRTACAHRAISRQHLGEGLQEAVLGQVFSTRAKGRRSEWAGKEDTSEYTGIRGGTPGPGEMESQSSWTAPSADVSMGLSPFST